MYCRVAEAIKDGDRKLEDSEKKTRDFLQVGDASHTTIRI
jgi:hypothetical protein